MSWTIGQVWSRKHKSSSESKAPHRKPTSPNMSASILDLPNELLVPILDEVVASIKPQESIRSGIVKLSSTCRRFHQLMQYFLESTCFVGISIPARKPDARSIAPISVGPPVNVSYRLVKYNTKGARGPYVKKIDIYGGFRTSYSDYQSCQKWQLVLARSARRLRGAEHQLDVGVKALGAISNDLIHGFTNLTTASFQNSPESLFIHLIPGLQAILLHCPLLTKLKLILTVSVETPKELEHIFQELPQAETSAQLRDLDFFIQQKNSAIWVAKPTGTNGQARARAYAIEILGKVFGNSITSLRTIKPAYLIENAKEDPLLVTDPTKRWKLSALKSIQFPVASEGGYTVLTDYCEIDYHNIQELTINGPIFEKWNLGDETALHFLQKFSGVKYLNVAILEEGHLQWLYFILDEDVKKMLPGLRILEVVLKGYAWASLVSRKKSEAMGALERFGKKHTYEKVGGAGQGFYSDEVYRFSISRST
ncbi:hypothetical protein TWF281_011339 [Arthrobotrys megalospora]